MEMPTRQKAGETLSMPQTSYFVEKLTSSCQDTIVMYIIKKSYLLPERLKKMESVVTSRGQVVVPGPLRKKYKIFPGMRLQWIDTGAVMKVIPIPSDPIGALRGSAKGESLVDLLLEARIC